MNTHRFRYEFYDQFGEQQSATVWATTPLQAVAIVAEQLAPPLRLIGLDPEWDMVKLPGCRALTREQFQRGYVNAPAAMLDRIFGGAHAA